MRKKSLSVSTSSRVTNNDDFSTAIDDDNVTSTTCPNKNIVDSSSEMLGSNEKPHNFHRPNVDWHGERERVTTRVHRDNREQSCNVIETSSSLNTSSQISTSKHKLNDGVMTNSDRRGATPTLTPRIYETNNNEHPNKGTYSAQYHEISQLLRNRTELTLGVESTEKDPKDTFRILRQTLTSSTNRTTQSPDSRTNDDEPKNLSLKPSVETTPAKPDMFRHYQPWVIRTYGDLSKTKTVTLKKYARIVNVLKAEQCNQVVDSSKFRFWVKSKGFRMGQPHGYDARPADGVRGRFALKDLGEGGPGPDPVLYIPNVAIKSHAPAKPDPSTYRKVAIVENFFDVIYSVHVELEGRPGKHAGQKRTYRTITESYAFLPREAVTRFLLGCFDCQKRPRSPSPLTPIPKLSLPKLKEYSKKISFSIDELIKQPERVDDEEKEAKEDGPLSLKDLESYQKLLQHTVMLGQLTGLKHMSEDPQGQRGRTPRFSELHSKLEEINDSLGGSIKFYPSSIQGDLKKLTGIETDESGHQTSTYLKYMRRLGYEDEDALKFESYERMSTPDPAEVEEVQDPYAGSLKDAEKLKLMILASYYSQAQGQRNGDINQLSGPLGEIPQIPGVNPEDMAGIWASYHSALSGNLNKNAHNPMPGLIKPTTPPTIRDQSSPALAETGSNHDETSSSGNKEDEDDDDDEIDERIDNHSHHDPERLKAFNMFVRLFVDENLDRIVPISKQPKEKIQAIIDSCTRQFPEFAERARKRIRTYLKSCRRNKRCRDPGTPWDATRPTPAHLTSVQAEQILASACENESMNAKRMRMGIEPISQPMPLVPGSASTDTTAGIPNRLATGLDFTVTSKAGDSPETPYTSAMNIATTAATSVKSITTMGGTITSNGINLVDVKATNASPNGINSAISLNVSSVGAPTSMYRPNFSQAFQRSATSLYPPGNALFPSPNPFNLAGVLGTAPSSISGATNVSPTIGLTPNGATDLSMKPNNGPLIPAPSTQTPAPQKPLLTHKLNPGEITAVRQLITGYRESAAFLLRSADELEQLLLQQQQ